MVSPLPMGFLNAAQIASRQMELWIFPLVAWAICQLALALGPNSLSLSSRLTRSLRLSAWIAFVAYLTGTCIFVPLHQATALEAWQAIYDVIDSPAWRPQGMSTRAWGAAYTYCAWPLVIALQAVTEAWRLRPRAWPSRPRAP